MLSHDVMTVARWLANAKARGRPLTDKEIEHAIAVLGAIAAGVAVLETQYLAKPQVILDLDGAQLDDKIVPLHRPRPGGAA